jgi:hypothetical protein
MLNQMAETAICSRWSCQQPASHRIDGINGKEKAFCSPTNLGQKVSKRRPGSRNMRSLSSPSNQTQNGNLRKQDGWKKKGGKTIKKLVLETEKIHYGVGALNEKYRSNISGVPLKY